MRALKLPLKILRTRFYDQRPFILSHLLTARCNADCLTCLWKRPADSRADELSIDEISALYRQAASAGFQSLVLWGGEPMVRPDAGQALAVAAGLGLDTTLITNGYFLAERGDEVLPHLRRMLVSVDAIGPAHDRIRRCAGLFERLDRGLALAQAGYPRVSVVLICVLSRLNAEHLESVAAYAKERGLRVIFQAMNFSDYGFAERTLPETMVQLSVEEETRVADTLVQLRERGYPVRDSSAYLARLGQAACAYRCHYKKVALRVEPNGDILDCTTTAEPLVSVRQTQLAGFLASDQFHEFIARAEQCNRCRDTGVIEASHMWEGRAGAWLNAVRGLR
jgi:MoaA/NifB/PqqE/SkfB family radical SAM enzyme